MRIEVHNTCDDFNSYRAARVKSLFNPERGNEFHLVDDLDIEDGWQIGLIVGPSGTGKTSIGRSLFGGGKMYDLYGGWDTTKPIVLEMYAKCYGISPDYCAVTLERMQTAFPDIEIKRLEMAEAAKT